jgi:imidazole glycerol-phosphate synthase subunit HisH
MTDVSILDYKMGNISSVKRKVEKLGYSCKLISSSNEILNAKRIILPGVGHFKKAMLHIKKNGLDKSLNHVVLEKKVPVLGICLGMQLMCSHSEEGNVEGLGWFNAKVSRFKIKDQLRFRTPHIGWKNVRFNKSSDLSKSISKENEFYFVHEYCVKEAKQESILSQTIHETHFISGLYRDNIFGVQFHPEKSHKIGDTLIKNFLEIKC